MNNDFNKFVKNNWKQLLTKKQQKYYEDMTSVNDCKYSKQLKHYYNIAIRTKLLKAYKELIQKKGRG